MNCEEVRRWIGPLRDGELDARNAADVQAHLAICPTCRRRFEVEQTFGAQMRGLDLAYAAPDSLRRKIAAALEELAPAPAAALAPELTSRPASAPTMAPAPVPPITGRATQGFRRSTPWLLWAGWPVAVAASGLLATFLLQQRSLEANEVVAAHVRSLQAAHLSDVVSTDRHTVKPWFAGRLDFAPPVPDLAAAGFELVGGRLDYLRQEPVAAVIYRKHGHIINVLSSPTGRGLGDLPHIERLRGYSLRAWRQAGLDIVAVSDIEPRELASLEQAYRAAPQPAAEPSG